MYCFLSKIANILAVLLLVLAPQYCSLAERFFVGEFLQRLGVFLADKWRHFTSNPYAVRFD
jgi:hypothetical protein